MGVKTAISPLRFNVRFERRPDGGLRAYSDDVPGFVLSYADPEDVFAEVIPVLETILSAMFDTQVMVVEPVGIRKALGLDDEPERMPAFLCDREYVGLSRAA